MIWALARRRTMTSLAAARRWRSSLTNIVGDEDEFTTTHVARVSRAGIELTDGLILPGACLLLDGRVFLWDVPRPDRPETWTRDLFAPFDVVVPKPELLLLGTGARLLQPPASLRSTFSDMGVSLDVMDTRNACATYNLLLEEGRRVAAALIPPDAKPWR